MSLFPTKVDAQQSQPSRKESCSFGKAHYSLNNKHFFKNHSFLIKATPSMKQHV